MDDDVIGRLQQALAEDDRTTELGVRIEPDGDGLVLRGDVASAERRDRLAAVVAEIAPGSPVDNQVRVTPVAAPTSSEEIR